MKSAHQLLLAAATLALVVSGAYADTTSSNQDKTVMERKASPSAPVKQDEERTGAHSQPNVPNAGGTSPRTTDKAPAKSSTPKKAKKEGAKDSSSSGSSAPSSSLSPEKDLAFKALDIDGDGHVSKAEAAGHAEVVKHFYGADRNRDGKLSRAEYEDLDKPRMRKQARASVSGR